MLAATTLTFALTSMPLFAMGPASEAAATDPAPVEATVAPVAASPQPQPMQRAPRRAPNIPDAFGGGQTKEVVFGDPFATSAARHRPYEPDPVHAPFVTPRRSARWVSRPWYGGYYWGAPRYYYGSRWGGYYGGYYPGYWGGVGVGLGVGAATFGLGIAAGALFL